MNKCLHIFCCVFLSGCTAVVRELHKPPFPYTVIHHSRAVGVEATIPSQTGDSILKFRLGWFSDTIQLIPSCTNSAGNLSTATISDDFKLDNSISLSPTTKIIESLTTGFTGTPPAPRFQRMFDTSVGLRTMTNSP